MKLSIHALPAIFAMILPMALQAAGTAADSIEVSDAYVREVPPVSQTTAAFMTLSNSSDSDHAVVAANSAAAATVELHTHLMGDDGVHRMREVENISVPAGGQAMLKPGGLHIMLIDLANPLKAGDEVALTLEFGDGSKKDVTAMVKSVESTMGNHKEHHH